MWIASAAIGLLGVVPVVALAQSEGSDVVATVDSTAAVDPTLNCNLVGLRILIDDLNGARVVCRVTGASPSDSSFNVSVIKPGVPPQPMCTEALSDGAGVCRGALVDLASSFSVTATLQPSGAVLGPVSVGRPAPAPQTEAPMQFFPLGD